MKRENDLSLLQQPDQLTKTDSPECQCRRNLLGQSKFKIGIEDGTREKEYRMNCTQLLLHQQKCPL